MHQDRWFYIFKLAYVKGMVFIFMYFFILTSCQSDTDESLQIKNYNKYVNSSYRAKVLFPVDKSNDTNFEHDIITDEVNKIPWYHDWKITSDYILIEAHQVIQPLDFSHHPNLSFNENIKIIETVLHVLLYIYNSSANQINTFLINGDCANNNYCVEQNKVSIDSTIANNMKMMRQTNDAGTWNLYAIQKTFVRRMSITENIIYVSVPYYQICINSGQTSGYMLLDFTFNRTNEGLKLIDLLPGGR